MLSRYWLAGFQIIGIVLVFVGTIYLSHAIFAKKGLRIIRVLFGVVLFCLLGGLLFAVGRFFLFPLPLIPPVSGSYANLQFDEALGTVLLAYLISALLVLIFYTDRFLTVPTDAAKMLTSLAQYAETSAQPGGALDQLWTTLLPFGLATFDHGGFIFVLTVLLAQLLPLLSQIPLFRTRDLPNLYSSAYPGLSRSNIYSGVGRLNVYSDFRSKSSHRTTIHITRGAVFTGLSSICLLVAVGLCAYAVITRGQPLLFVLLHSAIIAAIFVVGIVLIAVPIASAGRVSRAGLTISGITFLVFGTAAQLVSPIATLLNVRVS